MVGQTVCARPGCVAVATRGDLCALHGAGYAEHDGADSLLCQRCQKAIRKTKWYLRDGYTVRHAKDCEPAVAKTPVMP